MRERTTVSALDAPVTRRALLGRGLLGAATFTIGSLAASAPTQAIGSTRRLAEGTAPSRTPQALWTLITPAADRPPARRDHTLTADLDGGTLYVFGGRTRGGPLGDLWTFDPASTTWSEIVAE